MCVYLIARKNSSFTLLTMCINYGIKASFFNLVLDLVLPCPVHTWVDKTVCDVLTHPKELAYEMGV